MKWLNLHMTSHEQYMRRALQLAELGLEHAAPNPMVGAVIVYQDKIIGEGYHERCGEAHAEVNAINQVEDKSVLQDATMYVTLEPCAHFGKTPPCADLLVKHQLKRVFIAQQDPFSEVSGKGIERLKQAGIEVHVGILENEAKHLNRRFLTFHLNKRPYIILKWAESSNGFMDIDRSNKETGIYWITQPETKSLTHQWRAEESAILVGVNTILTDNPSLTTRNYAGKNPVRIVLDPNQKTTGNEAVFSEEARTIVCVMGEPRFDFHHQLTPFNLESLMAFCFDLKLTSVIIEGGQNTLQRFIDQGLWDEARILRGSGSIIAGKKAPEIQGKSISQFAYGMDTITILKPL